MRPPPATGPWQGVRSRPPSPAPGHPGKNRSKGPAVSEHKVEVVWSRDGAEFGTGYDRNHSWLFEGGVTVPASSAPGLSGDPARVDPEEAFVASISSCHMLWFLHLAGDRGLVVDRYADAAVGTMARGDDGRIWVTKVDLRPEIHWSGTPPSATDVDALHHLSHERCFIANSVRTTITVHAR
jgi:organic hydroperoxide reductase OsmC/OhrA